MALNASVGMRHAVDQRKETNIIQREIEGSKKIDRYNKTEMME